MALACGHSEKDFRFASCGKRLSNTTNRVSVTACDQAGGDFTAAAITPEPGTSDRMVRRQSVTLTCHSSENLLTSCLAAMLAQSHVKSRSAWKEPDVRQHETWLFLV